MRCLVTHQLLAPLIGHADTAWPLRAWQGVKGVSWTSARFVFAELDNVDDSCMDFRDLAFGLLPWWLAAGFYQCWRNSSSLGGLNHFSWLFHTFSIIHPHFQRDFVAVPGQGGQKHRFWLLRGQHRFARYDPSKKPCQLGWPGLVDWLGDRQPQTSILKLLQMTVFWDWFLTFNCQCYL